MNTGLAQSESVVLSAFVVMLIGGIALLVDVIRHRPLSHRRFVRQARRVAKKIGADFCEAGISDGIEGVRVTYRGKQWEMTWFNDGPLGEDGVREMRRTAIQSLAHLPANYLGRRS